MSWCSYSSGSFTHTLKRKDKLDIPPPTTGTSLWVKTPRRNILKEQIQGFCCSWSSCTSCLHVVLEDVDAFDCNILHCLCPSCTFWMPEGDGIFILYFDWRLHSQDTFYVINEVWCKEGFFLSWFLRGWKSLLLSSRHRLETPISLSWLFIFAIS